MHVVGPLIEMDRITNEYLKSFLNLNGSIFKSILSMHGRAPHTPLSVCTEIRNLRYCQFRTKRL